MRKAIWLLLLALLSCSERPPAPPPAPRALPFTVIRSGAAPSCVEPPEVALARDEDDWIDVFDFETDCTDESDITLPDADLSDGPVVVVWLRSARCAGEAVTISSVRLIGDELEIAARSEPQPDPCRRVEQVLEAFVQVRGDGILDPVRSITAVLDGQRTAGMSLDQAGVVR